MEDAVSDLGRGVALVFVVRRQTEGELAKPGKRVALGDFPKEGCLFRGEGEVEHAPR